MWRQLSTGTGTGGYSNGNSGEESDGTELLTYKAPGCDRGAVRKLRNKTPPALKALLAPLDSSRVNGIFFSVRGARSEMDKHAGACLPACF